MKFLVTGFDPFGGEKVNPSFESVKGINDEIEGVKIVKREIPTVFEKSIDKLYKIIEEEKPNYVICLGQAGGRFNIAVERVAININNARIPDNEGNQPMDTAIFEDGENAYFTNLPINAIVEEMKQNNIPASISYTAGTYVCNNLFYGLMYLINKKYPNIKGGFIHVPYLPEQVVDKSNTPFMTKEQIIKAIEIAIKMTVTNEQDIKVFGGEIF